MNTLHNIGEFFRGCWFLFWFIIVAIFIGILCMMFDKAKVQRITRRIGRFFLTLSAFNQDWIKD